MVCQKVAFMGGAVVSYFGWPFTCERHESIIENHTTPSPLYITPLFTLLFKGKSLVSMLFYHV